MLMLKSNDGRAVRYHKGRNGGDSFAVENGDGTSTIVPEAVVCEGSDHQWSNDHVDKAMKSLGFDWLKYKWDFVGPYDSLSIYCPELRSCRMAKNECWLASCCFTLDEDDWVWRDNAKKHGGQYGIDGHTISLAEFQRLATVLRSIDDFHFMNDRASYFNCLGGRASVTLQQVLQVIGIGNTVTPLLWAVGAGKMKPDLGLWWEMP
jgi:hypothetical protein